MLMIKLVNPMYYMPVKGDYRYMVGNANVASSLGIPAENIILKQNNRSIPKDRFSSLEYGMLYIKREEERKNKRKTRNISDLMFFT